MGPKLDWLPEFGDDDLDTLMEALEAWESKDQASEMFGDLVGAVMMRDVGETTEFAQHQSREKIKRERAKVARKERSVLLRAKLLTLRDRRRVERVITTSLDQSKAADAVPGGLTYDPSCPFATERLRAF